LTSSRKLRLALVGMGVLLLAACNAPANAGPLAANTASPSGAVPSASAAVVYATAPVASLATAEVPTIQVGSEGAGTPVVQTPVAQTPVAETPAAVSTLVVTTGTVASAIAATTEPAASASASPAAPAGTPAAGATLAVSATPASAFPQISPAVSPIANAERALLNAKAVRVTSTSTLGSGQMITNVVEFQGTDRVHETSSQGTEIILIRGQGTWQKQNGQWTKSPVDIGGAIFASRDPNQLAQFLALIEPGSVQSLGTQTLNGVPCQVYQYSMTVKGDASTNSSDTHSTTKIWIGQADDLPRRSEVVSDSLVNKGTQIHTTVTYDYNANVNIQPPTP
jgi:hypothetical protein